MSKLTPNTKMYLAFFAVALTLSVMMGFSAAYLVTYYNGMA